MNIKDKFLELFPKEDYDIYESYLGRFMYGEKTVGIIVPQHEICYAEVKLRDAKLPFSIDNLGLDFIIYARMPESEYKAPIKRGNHES